MNSYLLTSLPPVHAVDAELFSREWLNPILLDPHPFELTGAKLIQPYKERTMVTQQKLTALHTRLDGYNSTLFGNSVASVQQTVAWMRDKLGLWHIVPEKTKGGWMVKNVLMRKEDENSLSHKLHWDGYVWGWESRESGLVFVMLDGTAVTWLNMISKWCDEVARANEKEMV